MKLSKETIAYLKQYINNHEISRGLKEAAEKMVELDKSILKDKEAKKMYDMANKVFADGEKIANDFKEILKMK